MNISWLLRQSVVLIQVLVFDPLPAQGWPPFRYSIRDRGLDPFLDLSLTQACPPVSIQLGFESLPFVAAADSMAFKASFA